MHKLMMNEKEEERDYYPVEIELMENQSQNEDDDSFKWTPGLVALSIFLFIVAGIFEVGGGYLMWLGIREKRLPYAFIPVGAVVLMIYGVIPTFQPVNNFGRIFAVYGGFFILLSYLWGFLFDGLKLDTGDYVGTAIALAGVGIAWFWPR